jgi:hypothetical protein
MGKFDGKQKSLINTWHDLSEKTDDPYMAFMAEWIAFNAICYNLYYEKATSERANIDTKKSKLQKINEKLNANVDLIVQESKLVGTIGNWSIELKLPERLFISVTKKYTEDKIFQAFVEENQSWYKDNPTKLFDDLKISLSKGSHNYVINMAKSKNYDKKNDIDTLAENNIIVLCEKNDLETIKNVLYQIRCNIFHGEKTPGEINDDRIVKSSLPILRYIVSYLLEKHEINKKPYNSV